MVKFNVMALLYPLKFTPIVHEKIWGGSYLYSKLGKGNSAEAKYGESWEISTVEGNISMVSNGYLAGNALDELIEIYMGELVGDAVYQKFGTVLPVLVKVIDANADLSIQVHPSDEVALKKHKSLGKTEMWYIMDAAPGATIIPGFEKEIIPEEFASSIKGPEIMDSLAVMPIFKGDVFYIPAGRVHALRTGTIVVEIQETSDVTYRIYDYNRKDDQGKERELHVQDALEVMDFSVPKTFKTKYELEENKPVNLAKSPFFTTNIININKAVKRDYYYLDSFVLLVCLEGNFTIQPEEGDPIEVALGESVMIPADTKETTFIPKGDVKILEVYYETEMN